MVPLWNCDLNSSGKYIVMVKFWKRNWKWYCWWTCQILTGGSQENILLRSSCETGIKWLGRTTSWKHTIIISCESGMEASCFVTCSALCDYMHICKFDWPLLCKWSNSLAEKLFYVYQMLFVKPNIIWKIIIIVNLLTSISSFRLWFASGSEVKKGPWKRRGGWWT